MRKIFIVCTKETLLPLAFVCRGIVQAYLLPGAPADIAAGQLAPHLKDRVLPTMDIDILVGGPSRPALQALGFSIFHGGVCHSVVKEKTTYYSNR